MRKESCGVPQMRSLLLGANHAGLKLDRLCCGNVHWEFFKQTEVDFAEMKYAVRYLTLLNMHVTTRTSDEDLAKANGDDYNSQIPPCADFLNGSGRMRDFFTAAPDLRTLDISFDCENPHPPAGLKEMVGDITWHSLHYAAFNVLQTTEDELMHFYTRHAGILCGITLDTIKLTKGSWPCLLQRIRKTLSLKKAMICGHVTSSDPEEDFDFDLPPDFNNGVGSLPGRAVEKYLMLGGDGSLLDLNALGEDEAFKPESDWHEMFMT